MKSPGVSIVGLFAETPIHIGIGQVAGAIDLPVARDVTNGYPILPGSSLKGAFRDHCRWHFKSFDRMTGDDPLEVNQLFGGAIQHQDSEELDPDELLGDATDAAGSVLFGEGRLLLLPVRSLSQSFRWVTCRHVLRRLEMDLGRARAKKSVPRDLTVSGTQALVSQAQPTKIYLEELSFDADVRMAQSLEVLANILTDLLPVPEPDAADLVISKNELLSRLTIVSDEVFGFLARTSLPVRTRNRLQPLTKQVVGGHLWTEELVPSETLFYSILAERSGAPSSGLGKLEKSFGAHKYLQVGGKETIGCGWFALRFSSLAASSPAETAT